MATGTGTTTADEKPIGKGGINQAAMVSEMKDLGWNAKENTDGTGYSAHEINGDRKLGPAKRIDALLTQVKLASGSPVQKANGKGNGKVHRVPAAAAAPTQAVDQRLPTMEEPEIDELNLQADNCIDALEKRKAAVTASKDQDDIMRQKMREFGRKRYSRHGWSLVIEDSEKLVIKKAEQAPAKNPKRKATEIV